MIGLIMASTGALLIGLVIGHTWGEYSGIKKARTIAPDGPVSIIEHHTEAVRFQCVTRLRIPKDTTIEAIVAKNTDAVYGLCEKLGKELLHCGVIVPKIVERNVGPYRDANEIFISFFVAPDPTIEEYPDVVFRRQNIAGSRLGQF